MSNGPYWRATSHWPRGLSKVRVAAYFGATPKVLRQVHACLLSILRRIGFAAVFWWAHTASRNATR